MSKPCKATVEPGVCRLKTVIIATLDDDTSMVAFNIESECPNIKKLAALMTPICPYTEVEAGILNNEVYKRAGTVVPHAACPVPCAMMKSLEAAGGLALRKNVTITIE